MRMTADALVADPLQSRPRERGVSMPMTTVTREQLYERLWQTPTVHLCKEFPSNDRTSISA
jgi:hypothetical protein